MTIKKLLFPTKFRSGAFELLQKVVKLSEVGLEEIEIFHVIEKQEVSFDMAGYLKELEEKLRRQAESVIEDWKRKLEDKVKVSSKIVVGVPEYEILAESESFGADIVVMGKPTEGVIKRLFMGSTIFNLISNIKVPAIAAKLDSDFLKDDRGIFEKVIFATDGSDPCKRAFEFLKTIKPLIKKVELISVVNIQRGEEESFFKSVLDNYSSMLAQENIEYEPHLLYGKPSQEIVNLANYTNGTLIVMGTTGKDKIEDIFIGSATHRVVEKSKVPVMLVP